MVRTVSGSTVALSLLLGIVSSSPAQQKRPLETADLFRIVRVSEPALSPDGKWIAYTETRADLPANKLRSSLRLIPSVGGPSRPIAQSTGNNRSACWSPDGKRLAYISTRSGDAQVWILDVATGKTQQFTKVSTEASTPVWSPDGSTIAFVSEVFPENSDKPFAVSDSLNARRIDQLKNGVVKARIFTQLLYREWDSWRDGKRKHIFVQPVAGGAPRDCTPGDRDAVPFSSTFSGGIDFAFSPDGKEIAYTATPVPTREEAWSTNHDMYTVPVAGGPPKQITTNPAADGYPRYSPNGRYIAYRAQSVPDFEADRWQLMLHDRSTGTHRSLTTNFDCRISTLAWDGDNTTLYFECEDSAQVPIFTVTTAGDDVHRLVGGATHHNLRVAPDGKRIYFTRATLRRPEEICSIGKDGRFLTQITRANDSLFATIDIPAPQSVWYDGAGGTKIQAWLFLPPGFDASKKYPLVLMVHGGPQNAFLNSWSFRWNQPLWAAQGYVVLAPNPRGSTGFGQQFTNEISNDWGGKVFIDLMKGLDYACSLAYVDTTRKAGAGASFGGYMMNWFQAQAGARFRALVTHDGVYNFESMYGTTEEVWFDEWDHGEAPWDHPEAYHQFSPNVYAKNFRTPDLIIHSELDFRVPLSEGMQLFTALQRQGVPSKFLYFPDEGHTIMKPANSELWHKTVFDWLSTYLKH